MLHSCLVKQTSFACAGHSASENESGIYLKEASICNTVYHLYALHNLHPSESCIYLHYTVYHLSALHNLQYTICIYLQYTIYHLSAIQSASIWKWHLSALHSLSSICITQSAIHNLSPICNTICFCLKVASICNTQSIIYLHYTICIYLHYTVYHLSAIQSASV